jgi:hypothetical protein
VAAKEEKEGECQKQARDVGIEDAAPCADVGGQPCVEYAAHYDADARTKGRKHRKKGILVAKVADHNGDTGKHKGEADDFPFVKRVFRHTKQAELVNSDTR